MDLHPHAVVLVLRHTGRRAWRESRRRRIAAEPAYSNRVAGRTRRSSLRPVHRRPMWPRPGQDRSRCCRPAPGPAGPSGCRCIPAQARPESSACQSLAGGCRSPNGAGSEPPKGSPMPAAQPAARACGPASQALRRGRSGAGCQRLRRPPGSGWRSAAVTSSSCSAAWPRSPASRTAATTSVGSTP